MSVLSLDATETSSTAQPRRLRTPRYRVSEFGSGPLEASFEKGGTRMVCDVVDFSSAGVGLAVHAADASLFLPGDPLCAMRVRRADAVLFEGRATIRNVRFADGKVLVGASFDGTTFDMGRFYDLDLRHDVGERWNRAFDQIGRAGDVDPRFKAWVTDVAYVLDELHDQLAAEEQRVRGLDYIAREATAKETVELVAARLGAVMTPRIAELNAIVAPFDEEAHRVHRAYFQRRLLARFIDESPFFHRCYAKPLGHAGDYEIMNMVYRDHRPGTTMYGQALSMFGLDITASRAVANRIPFVSRLVAEVARRQPLKRLTSLACGPAREIAALLGTELLDGATVTLLDVEPLAIRYCEKTLLPQAAASGRDVQIRFIRESVRQIIRQRRLGEVLESQDVIVSLGLFDYFGDNLFQQLLARLYELLQPGGHLIIGNFDHTNDSRFLMEYVMEWYLQYRSADELRALAGVLPRDAQVSVDAEPLGINLFLHVRKPG